MAAHQCDNYSDCVTAIFFDLDNTLIQTRKADAKACTKLIEVLKDQYGLSDETAMECASTYLREFRKCPDNERFDLDDWRICLWENALPETHRECANDIFVQWLELRYHYLSLKPDVKQLLRTLRENYLLGLITNGPSRAQWEKIDRLELRDYFDCLLVSGDLPWEKPDQEIFHQACKILGVQPKQCIMVGDKLETDIQGGKEAELGGTVWIPLTEEDRIQENFELPDFTINSVTDLPELLPKPSENSNHFDR